MNRLAWFGRWVCYRWYLLAPINSRISWAVLPYAGDYAFQTFKEFSDRRAARNSK